MIAKGNRQNGLPVYINGETAQPLVRLPLDGRDFNESWIQQLIHHQPGILPIGEIEPVFSPPISIGREVSTKVGYIDNLLISPDGYLTIVETKLWRNPEARREVVGQIIDYAKELSKWTFSHLDNAISSFNRLYNQHDDGLLETVRKHTNLNETDEQFFIDNISKNLKRGRFLLLIVGDGIRESVEEMVEYLSQSPQYHFTLALIELQVFRFGDETNQLIVIPQVVTRTKEITRAIVKIEGSYPSDLTVNVETDLETDSDQQKNKTQARLTITAEDFFEQLAQKTDKETVWFAKQIIEDTRALGYHIDWNTGSFGVKLLDPTGSGTKITLFTVDRNGLVYLGFSQSAQTKLGIPLEWSYDLARDTAALLPNIQQNPTTKNSWNKYSSLADLKPAYRPFLDRVKSYADDIINLGRETD